MMNSPTDEGGLTISHDNTVHFGLFLYINMYTKQHTNVCVIIQSRAKKLAFPKELRYEMTWVQTQFEEGNVAFGM